MGSGWIRIENEEFEGLIENFSFFASQLNDFVFYI